MDITVELRDLATNLWWTWRPDVIAVFRDIDPDLWRDVDHNPIAFLAKIPPDVLTQRASELALEARVSYAFHRLHDYVGSRDEWGHTFGGPLHAHPVVYLSAEFGLHESLPIYSGGLGILAGDFLKSASDLGIPVVGVGLFYAQGYFNQRLDSDGWQQESYLQAEVEQLPLQLVTTAEGTPLRIEVRTRQETIALHVWRAAVGRSSLLLLDSDVEGNSESTRELTGRLYGGDAYARIRQELVLGVGGIRVLAALGIRPGVLHLNEGHSAFATLEMARSAMVHDDVPFAEAFSRVGRTTVFTTHTPVEAGHDRFDAGLTESVLGPMREEIGLSVDEMLGLGRTDANEPFCMTVLGIKAARTTNAVSSLHGHVSRRMWHSLWPHRPEPELPIGHITNGVHVSSWLAPPMRQLFDNYLGLDWERRMCDPQMWAAISSVDDAELWECQQILKARLVSYVQRQVCRQESVRSGTTNACDITRERLSPNVLTLGFSRRFATYKRADLLLHDEARLEQLVLDQDRPVQIIFAGKAHPKDDPGKGLIQRIFRMTQDPRFLGRIVFLEDYDINTARHLVQGVDVWLNTPRRPREASGTSGMKALFNGVLNLSVLDGWWAEAYDGMNGFAIGDGGEHSSEAEQDCRDAEHLYTMLEARVLPLYYDRNEKGVPVARMAMVKNAIRSLAWRFNADRMVTQYARECYLPLIGADTSASCTVAS